MLATLFCSHRGIALTGASIVSPIPSLSAHIESYGEYMSHRDGPLDSHEYVSLYFDWFEEASSVIRFVKTSVQWNLWSLVQYYNAEQK